MHTWCEGKASPNAQADEQCQTLHAEKRLHGLVAHENCSWLVCTWSVSAWGVH